MHSIKKNKCEIDQTIAIILDQTDIYRRQLFFMQVSEDHSVL